ncbi:hypothetical protein FPV67DRAFT_380955 [Lyophyllum atratum]|nr:hypothetical protein FPV67DRAFT_380955 [Lyophyllum atratum]
MRSVFSTLTLLALIVGANAAVAFPEVASGPICLTAGLPCSGYTVGLVVCCEGLVCRPKGTVDTPICVKSAPM